jgi:hypothetical protein
VTATYASQKTGMIFDHPPENDKRVAALPDKEGHPIPPCAWMSDREGFEEASRGSCPARTATGQAGGPPDFGPSRAHGNRASAKSVVGFGWFLPACDGALSSSWPPDTGITWPDPLEHRLGEMVHADGGLFLLESGQ